MTFASLPIASVWTGAFSLLLVGNLLLRLWLASRQIRHVARHRQRVPAAFVANVDLAAHQKAAAYTIAKERFGLFETAFGSAVLIGWTLLGGLDALNQQLRESLGSGMLQQLALLGSFVLLGGLLELPFGWYRTFRLEARFGFNKTTPRLWLSDIAKGTVLAAAIGLPIAATVLWLMEVAGPRWWGWAWVVWTGFNLLMLVLYPSLIAPIFNRFTPLADDALKTRVQALMQRCGFTSKGFFVMDGSRRSAHANAYFTGFGPAKRVVFFDTLLQQLTPDEVDAVLAHELGHFKHRHIAKRMLGLFTLSLLGFGLLGWLYGQSWFYIGLGVTPNLDAPNSALALLLFVNTVPLLTFFLAPLTSWSSRRHEFEADAYAARHASGTALRDALLKLYRDNANTLTPDPLYVAFYHSHPPALQRLARLSA